MDPVLTEPVNAGNPEERTILELAELVIGVIDSEVGGTFDEWPPQDPYVKEPDNSKARAKLEWEPGVGVWQELSRAVADLQAATSRWFSP